VLLANIHRGGVNVPLQTSAPPEQHAAIMAETGPRILAVSAEYVEAAVDAILLGPVPERLIVLDYDARDDDQRERFEASRQRLADEDCATMVDSFEDVIARGDALPEPPLHVAAPDEDPLAWLFYTSGSTGTPKGAIFTESLVIGTWLNDHRIPSITLSFMDPLDHPQLHADGPPRRQRLPADGARQRWHQLLLAQSRPFDAV
jgi:fatty acid CoA ligase FadD9